MTLLFTHYLGYMIKICFLKEILGFALYMRSSITQKYTVIPSVKILLLIINTKIIKILYIYNIFLINTYRDNSEVGESRK